MSFPPVMCVLLWMTAVTAPSMAIELQPVVDGRVSDVGPNIGEPFDGVPDYVRDDDVLAADRSELQESHGIAEFDLTTVDLSSIAGAVLRLDPIGVAYLAPATSLPVDLFAYTGNGVVELEDFGIGSLAAEFSVPVAPFVSDPIDVPIDISTLLQHPGYFGINLRLDPGVLGQANFGAFGSISGQPASLILLPVPEPSTAILILLGLSVVGARTRGRGP